MSQTTKVASLRLKPSQLVELLLKAIPAKRRVLIVGGPGIGKTSIVRMVADMLGAMLLLSTPSTEDPTEPKGFPWANAKDTEAHFKPFGNLATALAATAQQLVIWFLDDFGQALPAVQSGYMPLLQGRTADGRKLPDNVVFVAATNRRTDRAGVGGLLEPVKSRFDTIVELVPDTDEWVQWAVSETEDPIDPTVPAYIRWQPTHLDQFVPSADLVNCPSPRTWAAAGRIVRLGLPAAVEAAAINGAIGEGMGGQYLAFVQMFRQLPSVDAILIDPDNAKLPDKPNVLYAVATAVASRVTAKNFDRVIRYGLRLLDAGFGDFAALMIRDALRRKEELQQTPDFVSMMSGPLGKLIGGGD